MAQLLIRHKVVVLLLAMVSGGLVCPIAAYSAGGPVILETDYSLHE